MARVGVLSLAMAIFKAVDPAGNWCILSTMFFRCSAIFQKSDEIVVDVVNFGSK